MPMRLASGGSIIWLRIGRSRRWRRSVVGPGFGPRRRVRELAQQFAQPFGVDPCLVGEQLESAGLFGCLIRAARKAGRVEIHEAEGYRLVGASAVKPNPRIPAVARLAPTVARCAFCAETFEGTATEALEWSKQHRVKHRPGGRT
jgi:hypothetical protein